MFIQTTSVVSGTGAVLNGRGIPASETYPIGALPDKKYPWVFAAGCRQRLDHPRKNSSIEGKALSSRS